MLDAKRGEGVRYRGDRPGRCVRRQSIYSPLTFMPKINQRIQIAVSRSATTSGNQKAIVSPNFVSYGKASIHFMMKIIFIDAC